MEEERDTMGQERDIMEEEINIEEERIRHHKVPKPIGRNQEQRGLKKALEKENLEAENLIFEGQTQGNPNLSKGEG